MKILIAKWDVINKTPYLNMDVLMIGGDFLNIAIPVYHNQTKIYEWGTSINIQKNSLLRSYEYEIEIFKRIYEEAWDAGAAANSNNLIEMEIDVTQNNVDTIKNQLINKIEAIFNNL